MDRNLTGVYTSRLCIRNSYFVLLSRCSIIELVSKGEYRTNRISKAPLIAIGSSIMQASNFKSGILQTVFHFFIPNSLT